MLRRNAQAAVPHLDAHRLPALRAPAGHQHATGFGVIDRVADQVQQHALQQHRVGLQPQRAWAQAQTQALACCHSGKAVVQLLQQGVDGKGFGRHGQLGRVEPGVVKKGVEHVLQCTH